MSDARRVPEQTEAEQSCPGCGYPDVNWPRGRVLCMACLQEYRRMKDAFPALVAALRAALEELSAYRCDVSDYEAPENVDALDKTIADVRAALAAAGSAAS